MKRTGGQHLARVGSAGILIVQGGNLRFVDSLDRVAERVFDAGLPDGLTAKISVVLQGRANVLRGVPKATIFVKGCAGCATTVPPWTTQASATKPASIMEVIDRD